MSGALYLHPGRNTPTTTLRDVTKGCYVFESGVTGITNNPASSGECVEVHTGGVFLPVSYTHLTLPTTPYV